MLLYSRTRCQSKFTRQFQTIAGKPGNRERPKTKTNGITKTRKDENVKKGAENARFPATNCFLSRTFHVFRFFRDFAFFGFS